jgi:hypothetical protein
VICPEIIYRPRSDATPEAELSVLVAIYTYVLFNSQAQRGDPHDLTNNSTQECTTSQDKKGKADADIHGN